MSFIPQPNPQGNTAAYSDAMLDAIEQQIGSEVQLSVVEVEPEVYELDEKGEIVLDEENRPVVKVPALYSGAVMKYPSRDAIETYLTLKDRFPVQAATALLQDMCVPGHYDAEVFSDTKLFMSFSAAAQEVAAYKRAALKKRVRNGGSIPPTVPTSTGK